MRITELVGNGEVMQSSWCANIHLSARWMRSYGEGSGLPSSIQVRKLFRQDTAGAYRRNAPSPLPNFFPVSVYGAIEQSRANVQKVY